jgi:hypothetical protein
MIHRDLSRRRIVLPPIAGRKKYFDRSISGNRGLPWYNRYSHFKACYGAYPVYTTSAIGCWHLGLCLCHQPYQGQLHSQRLNQHRNETLTSIPPSYTNTLDSLWVFDIEDELPSPPWKRYIPRCSSCQFQHIYRRRIVLWQVEFVFADWRDFLSHPASSSCPSRLS